MNSTSAQIVGRVQAAKAVSAGIGVAYAIMAALSGSLLWISSIGYWPNLIFGATLLYLCAYYYGGLAGTTILLRKCNAGWMGTMYGLATLLTAAFLASWLGFFQEAIGRNTLADNLFDYIFKPLFWVAVVGFLPAALIGLWFGQSIKRADGRQQ